VSFSSLPLKSVTRLGVLGIVLAFALAIWVVVASIFDVRTPRGWASTAFLILFMGSIQLVSLGIIGEYLSRIFLEVKGRPTFLIARVVGGNSAPAGPGEPLRGAASSAAAGQSTTIG
jgi:dolichol-phosphate mannosyltransferase